MKSYYAILFGSLAVTGLGVTLAMHGEPDDAPGLAGIGILLIVGAFALGVHRVYEFLVTDDGWEIARDAARP